MTYITILLAVLCVEAAVFLGLIFKLRAEFKESRTHIEAIVKNESGVGPDEPERTKEQELAERMMLDGINNILSYSLDGNGGEGK